MSEDRNPIQGIWAGLVTWQCPISGYTVAEEPGIDAYQRVKNYTESMYPPVPKPKPTKVETPEPVSESVSTEPTPDPVGGRKRKETA